MWLQLSPIRRRLIHLAWPITLQFYLFHLAGLVDNLMVGQFGEQTIAALGICLQLNFFITLSYAALTEGGSVITAQLLGAQKFAALKETIGTLILSAICTGLMIGVLYHFAGQWLLSLLTTDLFRPVEERSALPQLGYEYLRVIGFGMICITLSQVSMHILQALGDTKTPMKLALYGNLLNVLGNFILLFGGAVPGLSEPLFTPLGIRGVAIATVIAWAFQATFMLHTVLQHSQVQMRIQEIFIIVWSRLTKVLRLGYPLSIDGILWQGSSFVYVMMFNRVGAEAYAAFLVALLLRSFALAPGMGFQQAVAISLGHAVGGDYYQRAKAFMNIGIRSVLIILPSLALLIWLITPLFVQLYDVSEETRTNIIMMVGIGVLYSAATAVTMIIPGVLRAGGDTKAPMVITAIGFLCIGAPISYLFGLHLGFGLWGVFAGFVADEVAKALIMLAYQRRQTWLKNVVQNESDEQVGLA